jgi:hypothetical protein
VNKPSDNREKKLPFFEETFENLSFCNRSGVSVHYGGIQFNQPISADHSKAEKSVNFEQHPFQMLCIRSLDQ